MRNTRYNSGLTLIEILVVLSIIVILAAMIWRSHPALDKQASIRKQKQAFLILDEALQAYFDSTGTFPDVNNMYFADGTENLHDRLAAMTSSRSLLNKLPRAMVGLPHSAQGNVIPGDQMIFYDAWGSVLDYRWIPGEMSFPILESYGPNKQPEPDGDASSDDLRNR